MAKPSITHEAIRALATPESFARGREYLRDGAVSNLVRRGGRLTAEVEGSEPYEVTISLHDAGVADASCTCPYDWGGYCKHIVAVLLKFSDAKADVIERPPIAELLHKLDRADLVGLLEKRLDSDPALATWIELELATTVAVRSSQGSQTGERRPLIDAEPVREQARMLLAGRHRKGRYWDDYRPSGDIDELRRLVDKAIPFLEVGDGRNALRILEPIAETFVDAWLEHMVDSDEHMYELFADLGRLMAEAALMSDLSADDREALAETLEDWQSNLAEYGVDEGFDVAIRALATGWEEPALKAVLAGKSKRWPPSGRSDWEDTELTAIRLRVLDACGKSQEYLHLARAARARAGYATMLVKLQRTPEAVKYALKSFENPDEALELAQTLRNGGAHDDALKIAEAGLQLAGDEDHDLGRSVVPLAHWLRDYAGDMGKAELALKAAKSAFESSLSHEDFHAVRSRAGKHWGTIRADLLAHLSRATDAYDRTEIYLSEGLIDDAVRSVDDDGAYSADNETLMRLAEAAHTSHPGWVIHFAMAQATSIMDANNASRYELAAQWLEKAALAHEAAGRDDDWRACLEDLIDRHRRKYKLRPLLERLRR